MEKLLRNRLAISLISAAPTFMFAYLSRYLSGLWAGLCLLSALAYTSIAFWMYLTLSSRRRLNSNDHPAKLLTILALGGFILSFPAIREVNLNADGVSPGLVALIIGGYMLSWLLILEAVAGSSVISSRVFQHVAIIVGITSLTFLWLPTGLLRIFPNSYSGHETLLSGSIYFFLLSTLTSVFICLRIGTRRSLIVSISAIASLVSYLFYCGPAVLFALVEGAFFYPAVLLTLLILEFLAFRIISALLSISNQASNA